jgi:hypothetical protein
VRTPEIFLAHAPRGEGLRCALAYLSDERDVYGWFTGPRKDVTIASCYFLIEGYYTNRPMAYQAVDLADLHSAWSLDEPRRHELARMQEAFVHEWLQDREVRAGWTGLQVREDALARFSTQQPTWTHYSPGFARGVLRFLAKRWPLAYHAEGPEAEGPHRRAAGPRP